MMRYVLHYASACGARKKAVPSAVACDAPVALLLASGAVLTLVEIEEVIPSAGVELSAEIADADALAARRRARNLQLWSRAS